MSFSPQIRYALVNAAILLASAIQLVRGYKPLLVMLCAVTFLSIGNLVVYLSGSKQRAIDRKRKRDYYAGNV